jgi:glycosyltransferase involved in cell wall biosynthesis
VTRNRQVDVLYLYRVPVPGWAARILRRGRSKVLFDFDDALDEGDTEPGLFGRLRRRALRRGIENAIATARTTIASNRRNADAAAALGGSVVVVPTCVDVTRYPFRDRAETPGDGVVVGWVGTPSTAPYLCAIEEVLASLREIIPFRLRLIGAGRNPFRRVEADLRPWSLEREVDEISAFDVGLMPMPDTPWTSGKAALKALQYGASGAPTVASRTESNLEILGPGGGVLFATTPDEWATAVRSLLESPGLRSEIGRRGRAHVCRSYSVDAQLPRLLGVIRGAPVTAGEAGTR